MSLGRCVTLASLIIVITASRITAAPTIIGLYPLGVQRGHDAKVVIAGSQLTDPQDVVFYDPGIEVVELEANADNRVTAHLRIDADCRLGHLPFRVFTARGVSNLRQLGVTAFPCLDEVEAEKNKDMDPLVGVDVPREVTIRGALPNEDVDSFCVQLSAGEPFSYEVEGLRHGRVEMDAEIEIADPAGKIVHRCDDTSVTLRDPAGTYVAAAAGKYTIRIREARRRGGGNYQYLLHLGKFPRPETGMPGGGRPGEQIDVTWLQTGRDAWQQKIKLPVNPPGTFAATHKVYASNTGGISPTANEFRVVDLPRIEDVEPNDTQKAAQKITVPCAISGTLHEAGNSDHFQFAAKKGQRLDIHVFGRRFLRSPIDPVLRVRKIGGGQIVSADDNDGPDCMVEFTAPEDGDYVIIVSDHLQRGGPNYAYRIEAAPIKRTLTLRSPERAYRLDPMVNLARGNRMAVLINVERKHFGEPVELDWETLPAGVTVDAPVIQKGQDRVSVVFHADANTQRGGHLLPLTGRAKVNDEQIVGYYHQRTPYIRGQNNRDVWGYDADRLAVAITDQSPFTIEAAVPTVPLVRNGSLPLLVTVKRRDDFKGALKLNLLHAPSGVAARRDVMLPADKDSVELLLTANGGAQLAATPVVVIAEATHEKVPYITSSELVELRVEDSIFAVAFDKASVEQGEQTEMTVKLTKKRDYQGTLVAELVGLPSGTTSAPKEVPAGSESVSFPVTAADDARPGRFNTVICQLRVLPKPDATATESILHVLGTGQLRVDKPLPPPKPKKDG